MKELRSYLSFGKALCLCLFLVLSLKGYKDDALVLGARTPTFTLSQLLTVQLIPASEYAEYDCVLGNCTTDRVTNIFLNDVVDGVGPCFVAENLGSRSLGDVIQVLDGGGNDTLDFNFPALLDIIFNDPQCPTTLENLFADMGCLISRRYQTGDFEQILIRIVEAKSPDECGHEPAKLSTSCAPPDGACPVRNSRMVVNIVVSSFCGSKCVNPDPTCYYGLPSPAKKNLDWLIYRYELQKARSSLQGLIKKLQLASQMVEGDFEGYIPPAGALGDAIETAKDFLYNCIPDWDNTIMKNLS